MTNVIESVLAGYLSAVLCTDCDDDGEPLERRYSRDDIASDSLAQAREDVAEFVALAGGAQAFPLAGAAAREAIGINLWLTRNRHGAGFWDGAYSKVDEARYMGAVARLRYVVDGAIVGDDGAIHIWREPSREVPHHA